MTITGSLMQLASEVGIGFVLSKCWVPGASRQRIIFGERSVILNEQKMERYTVLKEVGDGTFGNVWRAINKQSGEIVAIKKMKRKYYSWEECMNLREVKSLRRMNHPNIVKLKEVIRENNVLYFVFEYMECNLYQLMQDRGKVFTDTEVRNWCFQIFHALAYMHQHGYFHRDLKPENLLVTKGIIKMADFGLAREICSEPPYTEYVSTRWYRAPEILLQASVYGSAVDMWAMGAIMAELFTLRPLFPGSNEADEIYKICSVIGSPNQNSWAEGLQLANAIKYQFPQLTGVYLSDLIPSASEDAINLISSLCSWDPRKRPKASEVLQHSFFLPCFYVPTSPVPLQGMGMRYTPPSGRVKMDLEQKNSRRYSIRALSNMKPASSFAPGNVNVFSRTGAQREHEMDSKALEQDKVEKFMKPSVKQSRYRAPARNNSGYMTRNSHGNADVAEKLAHMTLNSNKVLNVGEKFADGRNAGSEAMRPPPSMKAGRWLTQTKLPLGPYEISSGRGY